MQKLFRDAEIRFASAPETAAPQQFLAFFLAALCTVPVYGLFHVHMSLIRPISQATLKSTLIRKVSFVGWDDPSLPLYGPAPAGPGPFEKGLREAVGIDLRALLLLKSSNRRWCSRGQSPALASLRGPLCQRGQAASPLVRSCGIIRWNYPGPLYNFSQFYKLK